MKKKGLLIVFEGIDYSGKNYQLHELERNLESFNKYQGVLRTQEPWESEDIKRKLERNKTAYSNLDNLAELFIDDRAKHTQKLIRPNLEAGIVVLDSRYKMSTCAYQWTQGVPLSKLIEMHNHRGILNPDLTFLLDITREESERRAAKSGRKKEKFEKDSEFIDRLISAYHCLTSMSHVDESIFGKVVRIDAGRKATAVSKDIWNEFIKVYRGN